MVRNRQVICTDGGEGHRNSPNADPSVLPSIIGSGAAGRLGDRLGRAQRVGSWVRLSVRPISCSSDVFHCLRSTSNARLSNSGHRRGADSSEERKSGFFPTLPFVL